MLKINDLGIEAIAHGTPLVLFEEIARYDICFSAALIEPGLFCHQRLADCREANDIIEREWHIEDAELHGAKKRMGTDIPPDFLGVVDAAGVDKCLYIAFVIAPRLECIG